jgi:hypothetical protein
MGVIQLANPQIVIEDYKGRHNSDQNVNNRLEKGKTYQDLSTICIVPTRGMIPAKVVQNWLGLMAPMNQKFMRMFVIGMEVGEAYTQAIEQILVHPDLKNWKYILTLEEDNMPPPDGLLKLYENIDKYDVVGGIYWTKGEGGQPMIYGNPKVMPKNFIPQIPLQDTIQEANGLGMGFNLFKIDIFKDSKLPKPFFKTLQQYNPGVGASCYTQDLYFYENAGKIGYKFACDTRIKVGHYDIQNDIVW